jgi:hypothetical protein
MSVPRPYLAAATELEDRLWAVVERRGPAECWFVRCRRPPEIHPALTLRGRFYYCHRVAWTVHHRKEPGSLVIRHSCDNPHCANPAHLVAGTPAENHADRMRTCGPNRRRRVAPYDCWSGNPYRPPVATMVRLLQERPELLPVIERISEGEKV